MAPSVKKRSLLAILFAAIDLAVATVLFAHGWLFRQQFLSGVYLYKFESSMFDIWTFSLLRTVLVSGASLGLMRNAKNAVPRLNTIRPLIYVIFAVISVFTVVKMLVYTEYDSNLDQPWFWSLFGWTLFADIFLIIQWTVILNLRINTEEIVEKNDLNINSSNEERRSLLEEESGADRSEKETNDDKKKTEKTSVTVGRLLRCSAPDWYILLGAFIFLCLSSVAQTFTPYFTGQVIDGIAIERSEKKFIRAIIIMALLSLGSSFAAGLRGGLFKVAMAKLNIRICGMLFASLAKQEVGFYDTTRTGEVTSRLTSDTTTMSDTLCLSLNVALRSLIQAIGVCVFMFKLSWRMSFITFIGLPIIMAVSEIYGEYYKKLSKKVQDSVAAANNVAEETVATMRTVRSFANESRECENYEDKLALTYKLKLRESKAYAGYMWCTNLFSLTLVVATLYYGGHLVVKNMVTGGNLVSFILYQMELGFNLESIAWSYTALMQAVGSSEKVFEFINRKPKIVHSAGRYKPENFRGKVDFKDVCFSYPSRPDTTVLKNISFRIEPGEVVALVGPSGGGKSTCVSLLEHFYQTSSGQVLLDDVPIEKYDHNFLHQKVSLVGQEPVLYARSIKDNIAYGLDTWTLEMVEKAARMANAHQFVTEMKENYETQSGEKGTQLSGGQKQRIAIARALIRNPTVLLLDEATSALDTESEHLVQEAIYKNLKGRTVVIIAHRLSTVEKCDRIIVINKGTVEEQGTHAQLLHSGGLYSQLVRRQLALGFDDKSIEKQPINEKKNRNSNNICNESYGSFNSFLSVNSASDHELDLTPTSRSPNFGSIC